MEYDIITWKHVESFVDDFARSIGEDRKYDSLLAISKGGLVPAVMLAHRLNIKNFYIIDIRRNSSNKVFAEKIQPKFQEFDYSQLRGKKILIVDDIAGTGKTLTDLSKRLKENRIKNFDKFVLVKFNGDYHPNKSLKIDYYGEVCPNWVVFPWEKKVEQ